MELPASVAGSNSTWKGVCKWTTTYYLWTTLLTYTMGHYTMLHYGLVIGEFFFFSIRSGLYNYPCMEQPASVADSNSTWNGVCKWTTTYYLWTTLLDTIQC
ncbi:hypothetical protein CEXT_579601 [Caerostris extrusa]|uniref:Uncharacterized protein n=1 Tax=Caerostris extrusa TaxID=172846 RepID=A0AAV4V1H6_CAEEX|nr:hypothetical protein CEXT_579601 [Caerostris extrusa]